MKSLRRNHTFSFKSSSSSSSVSNSRNRSAAGDKINHSSPSSSSSSSSSSSWVHLRSVLFIVASSSPASSPSSSSSHRGHLKSPWSRRRRKHALTAQQWRDSFGPGDKLHDGGVKLLKKVRSGGVDATIRAEVWPFLLGVYDLNSPKEERDDVRNKNRKEYEQLRRRCEELLKGSDEDVSKKATSGTPSGGNGETTIQEPSSSSSEADVVSASSGSLSSDRGSSDADSAENQSSSLSDRTNSSQQMTNEGTKAGPSVVCSDSSDSESSEDNHFDKNSPLIKQENDVEESTCVDPSPPKTNVQSEDFVNWQRIIRLDAVRTNGEWIPFSPSQAVVSEEQAWRSADAVGLKDYDHLDPCKIYHAARLVAILEAYAVYDSEIGYCQGMSDLLSPIITVIKEDHMAFWCFVGFMKKARHNFRLDELGIRRQLNIVSKIIKYKDSHLYRHLVQLQAEDCFFVYRMVVVLFRRELNFEQTLWLWEVMWADQAALRAGIGKSAWGRVRVKAPPTDDLLLYAIAASVLQRRKQIIETYYSMDEILRECNNMTGQLDVWKLLDDAHDLVTTLHDKIDTDF